MNQILTSLTEDFSIGITNGQMAALAIIPLAILVTFFIVFSKERRKAI
jgi:hypothetical protein